MMQFDGSFQLERTLSVADAVVGFVVKDTSYNHVATRTVACFLVDGWMNVKEGSSSPKRNAFPTPVCCRDDAITKK
jgi:hypothetical protein